MMKLVLEIAGVWVLLSVLTVIAWNAAKALVSRT